MAKQAFAAVARTPGGRWDIEDIMLEDPRPGEILVRIAGVGLCHTDLAFGGSLQIMKAPAVLGHEGSGIVERVGEGLLPLALDRPEWRFSARELRRARDLLLLERHFDASPELAAFVAERAAEGGPWEWR